MKIINLEVNEICDYYDVVLQAIWIVDGVFVSIEVDKVNCFCVVNEVILKDIKVIVINLLTVKEIMVDSNRNLIVLMIIDIKIIMIYFVMIVYSY